MSLCEWNLNRIWVSFEESVSLTLVLLLDVLDLHEHDSLGPAHHDHSSGLANGALQPQSDFLGGLGLLPEDGLGLASIAGLFAVVASPQKCIENMLKNFTELYFYYKNSCTIYLNSG